MLTLKLKLLNKEARIPTKAHNHDAGYDITATHVTTHDGILTAHTGLAIAVPEGYVGLLFPRSSIVNKGLMLHNAVGVLDSGYQGEITFKFKITDIEKSLYKSGDRIGQLVVLPIPSVEFQLVDSLPPSSRGTGGYGSTGA